MDEKLKTLYDLCDTLSEELEDVNEKIRKAGGMSAGDLETVDKLSHALKSIKTTIAMMEAEDEGGYSERYMPYYGGFSYADGMDRDARGGMSRRGGRSYARGRGKNVKRDSMGRYSRDGGYSYADSMESLLEEMRGMMHTLPEEKRHKAERLIDELSM